MDELARGFGIRTLWRDTEQIFAGSPSIVFSGAGVPGFLVEVGGGQPLRNEDLDLQAGAVLNFLKTVGVIPGKAPRLDSYTVVNGYRIVTNDRGGFFESTVAPGERIEEGTVLGRIVDVFGDEIETLRAPAGADIVLGSRPIPPRRPGDGCSSSARD